MIRSFSSEFFCLLTLQFGILNGAAFSSSFAAAGDPVTAIAVAPDGQGVVTGSHAGLFLHSGPQFRNTRRLPSEVESIHDLRFSADGTRLAVAGGTPGQFGLTEIFEWPRAEVTSRIREHDDVIYSVSWSLNQRWIATASLDGVCLVCDSGTGKPLHRIDGHSKGVTGIEWLSTSPPGGADATSLILTCSLDQTLRLWSLTMESPQSLPELVRTMDQHTGAITGIVLQPRVTGQLRVTVASWGDDRTVRFWHPENGRLLRFARLPSFVTAAVWSADGRELFAATESGAVARISFATAKVEVLCTTEPPATALILSPDQSRLISGNTSGMCSEISTRAESP